MRLGDLAMDTQDDASSTESGFNINNNNVLIGNVQENMLIDSHQSMLSDGLAIENIVHGDIGNDLENSMLFDNTQGMLIDKPQGMLIDKPQGMLIDKPQKGLHGHPQNVFVGNSHTLSAGYPHGDSVVNSCQQLAIPDSRDVAILLDTNQCPDPDKTGLELDLVNRIKTGDVEKEKMVEERVKALGLWNNKRILERRLHEQLSDNIDEDGLFQAINRCKRKRPLRERMDSTSNEIVNTIQPKLVKDDLGNNVSYKVDIMMGLFTHNVHHKVCDHTVIIQGSTPNNRHSKLHKEVTIEFPQNVEIEQIEVGFNAGVFKCEAPFKRRTWNRLCKSLDSVSSAQSEETESVTSSDMKSIEGGP